MIILPSLGAVGAVGAEVSKEEIRLMLAAIPPRPHYADWLRIASAVWSVLPMAEGARLLHEWSPEEQPGEYAEKHKCRLHQIGVGTLIFLAKQNGFGLHSYRAEKAARERAEESPGVPQSNRIPFRVSGERLRFSKPDVLPTTPPPAAPSLAPVATPAPPPPVATPGRPDPELVRHVAAQLAKIHAAGWITGPDDPDARTFAAACEIFEATPIL